MLTLINPHTCADWSCQVRIKLYSTSDPLHTCPASGQTEQIFSLGRVLLFYIFLFVYNSIINMSNKMINLVTENVH